MTDKEIKTEFIILQGQLFAIMQALAMVAKQETSEVAAFVKKMNDVAKNHCEILLQSLETQDVGDKTQ